MTMTHYGRAPGDTSTPAEAPSETPPGCPLGTDHEELLSSDLPNVYDACSERRGRHSIPTLRRRASPAGVGVSDSVRSGSGKWVLRRRQIVQVTCDEPPVLH